jgi:hypothetical protein
MITKTVGVGQDYATWNAAMAWLATQSPLLDDYTFEQRADTSEPVVGGTHNIDLNGWSVVCQNQTPHGGDPTAGNKMLSSAPSAVGIYVTLSGPTSSFFEIKDLNVQFTHSSCFAIRLVSSGAGFPELYVHDLILMCTLASGYGLQASLTGVPATGQNYHFWNISAEGFDGTIEMLTFRYNAMNRYENCFSKSSGCNGTTISSQAGGGGLVQNSVFLGSKTFGNQNLVIGKNNAADDTSVQDANWSSPGVLSTGNQVNINSANEFVSTVASSPDYGKVRDDGGGVCFDGGTTPSIATNTAGIRGTQRPQGNGDVSIGSDELASPPSPGGGGSGSGGGGISGAITAAMAAGY